MKTAWTEKYTDAEMIKRIWAVEEIKKLMSRRSFFIANGWRAQELDSLWVQAPALRSSASLGGNWGYYVGMDEIKRWYVTENEKRLNGGAERTAGYSAFHPVTTPLVKLAGDGKTARGLFYSIGEESWKAEDGAKAFWFNEKLAANFALEDGAWRIWHLVTANDFTTPAGAALSSLDLYPDEKENASKQMFGEPTMPMTVHDARFDWCDDYPPIPKDYESFDAKNSYAPAGHPLFADSEWRWR